MVPALPTTIAWITLLDPDIGWINVGLTKLGFVEQGPFNIFSVPGIVFANLMGHGISIKVMLLTPAFATWMRVWRRPRGRRRQQPAHSVQGHFAPDDFTDDSGLCAATPARLPVL